MPRRVDPRHPVWLISWLDASDAFPTWAKASSIKASDRERLVQSVGFLVEETDGWITLACSCTDEEDGPDHFGGGIHIPKPLVVGKRRLT